MDYLLKQTSGRVSGVQQENKEEESGSVKDRSIPRQKSQSFKGESNREEEAGKEEESGSVKDRSIPPQKSLPFKEKKKGQNWFQRQFFRQMSDDYSSDGKIEHAAIVAAAAIVALKESDNPNEKQTRQEPAGTSLIPIKSRKEDTGSKKFSFYLSGQDSKRSSENSDSKVPITASGDSKTPEKAVIPAPSVEKTPSSSTEKSIGPSPSMKKPSSFAPEKAYLPAPSVKKPPSFVDKQSNNTGNTKRGSATPKFELRTTVKSPPPPPPSSETNRQSLSSPVTVKSKADVWEESEIARINARFEKLQNTMRSWEQNLYKTAKSQNHKTERDLDKKGKKVLETFKDEMGLIDDIVRKERANVEEKLKKYMLKAKEMADEIRRTGKVP